MKPSWGYFLSCYAVSRELLAEEGLPWAITRPGEALRHKHLGGFVFWRETLNLRLRDCEP